MSTRPQSALGGSEPSGFPFTKAWEEKKGLALDEIPGFAERGAAYDKDMEKLTDEEVDALLAGMSTGARWKLLTMSCIANYMHGHLGDCARTGSMPPTEAQPRSCNLATRALANPG